MADDLLPPGFDLAGFTIGRPLGRGGMGTVYLARQRSLDREVAVKVLHPWRVRDERAAAAFFAEARTAGQLRHPGLVAIHDVIADPAHGLFAYAMEHVPGPTAARAVAAHGPCDRDRALDIAAQVAAALAAAHEAGLVHRDVKPGNIILDPDGTARLLDLGLVRNLLPAQAEAAGGRRLAIVGTVGYAAPEQLRDPEAACPASDVFALGATLHHLLAGAPPFDGSTVIDLIVRVCTEEPQPPAGADAPLRDLLRALMRKDPGERIPDGATAAERIAAVRTGRTATDRLRARRRHR